MDLEKLLKPSERQPKSHTGLVNPGPKPIDQSILSGMFEHSSTAKDSEEISDHFELCPDPEGSEFIWIPKTSLAALVLTVRSSLVSQQINIFIPREIFTEINKYLPDDDEVCYMFRRNDKREVVEHDRERDYDEDEDNYLGYQSTRSFNHYGYDCYDSYDSYDSYDCYDSHSPSHKEMFEMFDDEMDKIMAEEQKKEEEYYRVYEEEMWDEQERFLQMCKEGLHPETDEHDYE